MSRWPWKPLPMSRPQWWVEARSLQRQPHSKVGPAIGKKEREGAAGEEVAHASNSTPAGTRPASTGLGTSSGRNSSRSCS